MVSRLILKLSLGSDPSYFWRLQENGSLRPARFVEGLFGNANGYVVADKDAAPCWTIDFFHIEIPCLQAGGVAFIEVTTNTCVFWERYFSA
jgi:hypothetical protein